MPDNNSSTPTIADAINKYAYAAHARGLTPGSPEFTVYCGFYMIADVYGYPDGKRFPPTLGIKDTCFRFGLDSLEVGADAAFAKAITTAQGGK